MGKFFSILTSRVFLVSFLATLCAVAVFFAVTAVMNNGRELPRIVESHLPVRSLWDPEIPEIEIEPEDEWPPDTAFSVLTGLRIYEGYARRRPIGAVINNLRASHPQHGIASADIVYEVLAEGDVTRFVAIFQSDMPDKIGSIRSARDYFIDFAWNHDAVFVFHGASPGGHNRVRNTGITHLDGGRLEGRVFWRDRSFPDWAANSGQRAIEHSSFTSRERILTHFEEEEIRAYMDDNPAYGFEFGEIEARSLGEAHRVAVPFSSTYTRIFVFDEEENIYRVENPVGPQMDAETVEPAMVTNVLIQFAQMTVIDGMGRRNVSTVGEGRGYLITGGEHFGVRWEKASHTEPARWFFDDGTPLIMQPGRTWICVFTAGGEIIIEGTDDDDDDDDDDDINS